MTFKLTRTSSFRLPSFLFVFVYMTWNVDLQTIAM